MGQGALQIERLFLTVFVATVALPVWGADCNRNGIEDSLDLSQVSFEPFPNLAFAFRPTAVAISDLNRDGRPDLATVSRDIGVGSVLLNRGAASFLASPDFPVAPSAAALAAGDLDGDGAAELAIAAPFRLDLFRNDGAGGMAFAESFPLGSSPMAALFADLDGDGDPDLATANSLLSDEFPDNVSVFLGQPGGLALARNYGTGKDPRSIIAVDLDRDGDLDLVTAHLGSGTVSLLFNSGEGIFPIRKTSLAGGAPTAVITADLDGNGWPDLATAGNGLMLLIGRGQGNFDQGRQILSGDGPASLAAGHFDGDRNADLVVAPHQSLNALFLQNDGQGTFPNRSSYPFSFPRTSISAGDLDGDGDQDLAAVGGTLSLLLNQGSGTLLTSEPFRVGVKPTALALADFNGDGRLDLALGEQGWQYSGSVSVITNQGEGRLALEATIETGNSPHPLAAADLDGDRDPDLALIDTRGILWLALNPGGGHFSVAFPTAIDKCHPSLAASDVDGDGKLELLVGARNASPAVRVLSVEGDGSLVETMVLPTEQPPHFMVVEDLDGDRASDIALASGLSQLVSILWNDGRGRFPENSAISLRGPGGPVVTLDMDGDGDREVVANNHKAFVNTGQRNFTPAPGASMRFTSAAACDLDGDQDVDLALAGEDLKVVVNLGAGFSFSGRVALLPGASRVVCGDLDGDGLADLIAARPWAFPFQGQVSVLRNRTLPSVSQDRNLNQIPDECEVFRRGDFKADGAVDLSDAVHIILFILFLIEEIESDDPEPNELFAGCRETADANDDGEIDLTDAIRLLGLLFLGEGPLPPPVDCGHDPTDDDFRCVQPGC